MTPTVLVDSSVWIGYLRKGRGELFDAVEVLLDESRASLCGMVEMEVVQGLRGPERGTVSEMFATLRYLETERQDYITAGERMRELRRRGITIPAADCLIGVLCSRHNLPLLTLDKHFDHLPDVKRFSLDDG